MKKFIVVAAMTIMFSVLFCNHVFASGYIKGQLTDGDNYLAGVNVTFLNSENAQIMNNVTSDEDGSFMSSGLPPGQYKIHFSLANEYSCINEFLSSVATHDNVFDTGIAITVMDKQETDLGIVTVFDDLPSNCEPSTCVPVHGSITGYVIDSSTGDPIPDIQVQFKDPITAFPRFFEVTTESDGYFFVKDPVGCGSLELKVRFYDPNGIYSPEYYGAGGADDFSRGSVVNFADPAAEITEDLALLSPAEQIGKIIDDIISLLPPEDAPPIASSLIQGKSLLEDANPNNDQAACGILTGAVNKMNSLVSSGRLSQTDADSLMASMDALKIDLGCKR